ncbi:MAG: cation-translocating P-type ATPase [Candidatus Peribacteraceae bacterium]|nr:ATPase [bacterium]MDP6562040.1 cation-translocating P-type ATPase [Candidatus Peribacteraceae bacterium]|tara:strand:+ start:7053 stop:9527 length:2475 start_codon:yes stop_codon:yes gene_type:complete
MYASATCENVLTKLKSSPDGISGEQVVVRRAKYGANELPVKKKSLLLLFFTQFNDVMVYILFAALGISIAIPFFENGGHPQLVNFLDAAVILAILILNAVLGFVQEYKAEEAIAALAKLTSPHARVRREGKEQIIDSRELVPGDIVIVEAGDRVSADGRILSHSHLRVNESSLTGESHAVDKTQEPMHKDCLPLAEQHNMVFSGTLVTRGFAEYVVTSTALNTEIGKIAKLVSETEFPETPLQRRMAQLGKMLGIVVLVVCSVIAAIAFYQGLHITEILLITVSLAVSAVPEGLPAVVTVCLAMGVRRMTAQNALVRRLESLETLGSVTVICADKTGTITQNKMKVIDSWVVQGQSKELLAQIASSCNRAKLPDIGDPTEIGLLEFGEMENAKRLVVDDEEVPFTSDSKYMQTRHGNRMFLKGAPEKIVELAGGDYKDLLDADDEFAARGLRVLACAIKEGENVIVVGLVAMEDPPRATAMQAIEEAKAAGIRTIMITGDNVRTAQSIAEQVGIKGKAMHGSEVDQLTTEQLTVALEEVTVFARVSPVHKLKILDALQEAGEVIAMSGDGVNDAPALKGAHLGVAMGKVGTEVAREASSIVLADDHYATIVAAIREGRRIYDNIKKFVLFLLRANFDELLFIATTIILGMPLPYLPLHILWINLMTDGLPALALGMEPAERNIMKRLPRLQTEHILHGEWGRLVFSSIFAFAMAFLFFLWQLSSGVGIIEARSTTLTLAIIFELFLAFSVRSREPIWRIGFFSNRWMIGATAIPFIMQFVLLYTPLNVLFHVSPISLLQWIEVFALAGAGFIVFETMKLLPDRK